MELVPYTDEDMWLTEALETDPRVMSELGGPWPREKIPEIHRRRMAAIAKGNWNMKVVPEPGGQPVGAVMIWESEHDGQPISEAGWTILPEHQGRGYASEALRLLLERADAEGRWGDIHAFPGVTNGPSNALCRKFGFELVGEVDVNYGDRPLRCNHWVRRSPFQTASQALTQAARNASEPPADASFGHGYANDDRTSEPSTA